MAAGVAMSRMTATPSRARTGMMSAAVAAGSKLSMCIGVAFRPCPTRHNSADAGSVQTDVGTSGRPGRASAAANMISN